jgi:hypothetical protein
LTLCSDRAVVPPWSIAWGFWEARKAAGGAVERTRTSRALDGRKRDEWGRLTPLDYPSPPHRRSCVAGDDRLAHENDARRNWPGSGHEHHECVQPSPTRSRRYVAATKRGARSGRPGAPVRGLRQEGNPALYRWSCSVRAGMWPFGRNIYGEPASTSGVPSCRKRSIIPCALGKAQDALQAVRKGGIPEPLATLLGPPSRSLKNS